MASSEHPDTTPMTTGIQKPSGIQTPGETSPVALPPLPQKPAINPTGFLRLRGWLDAPIVAGGLLFAFLIASFPASNSDFFRHAAIGRLIHKGEYHFGVDPFVYTAGDAYFVNHSWLFDLLMYGLYQIPSVHGADAVVLFKAILIALLAGILLRASRRAGQSLWIPAVCTALAILVVSPRLLLQSTCLSYLFLGVTVWLLTALDKGKKWMGWLLPPLFVLWVNCDAWFVLGPLAVALYLVGGLIPTRQPASEPLAATGAAGWWILAVGVAACLINPHHIHAFTLPPEFGLTAAGGLLERDPQFLSLYLSPLGKDYYRPNLGLSAAGLAYWPLLLLGLASFVSLFLSGQAPWRRLLLWSGFALMSLYNVRTIPFFAIVAGPIVSLNWLDFAVQRLGAGPRLTPGWRSWSLGGRFLTGLLVLALLIAAVPGWLQASYPRFRRFGWNVQVNPSLLKMAQTIRDWRTAGLLPEQPHWFNLHHEIANYLAWYAPGERVFVDQSLPDFREAAQDYLDIRRGLEQMLPEQPQDEHDSAVLKTDWRKILREKKVRYWIFDNHSAGRAAAIARGFLFSSPDEWVLCHLQGQIAVFAWRDPQQAAPDPSTRLELDLHDAAFGPKAEQAPPEGGQPAPPREWWQLCWDAWRKPNPPLTGDREVIGLYEFRYQLVERPRHIYKQSRIWQSGVAASAIAGSLPHGPMPNSLLTLSWSCTYHDLFPPGAAQATRQPNKPDEVAMRARDSYLGSRFIEPPSLYLALRAARRALAVDLEDGFTYIRLGQLYQSLHDLPQERNLPGSAPQLAAIRRAQIAAALNNYLLLQPDGDFAVQAHLTLFAMYVPTRQQAGYIDAAVNHLRQASDKRSAAGPRPGESATRFNQDVERMSAELTRLDGELQTRLSRYEVTATAKTGVELVKAALELGLPDTALTALKQVSEEEASGPGNAAIVNRVAEVMLELGQLEIASELLPDPMDRPLELSEMDRYLRLAAARGDYDKADRILNDALQRQPVVGDLTFATAQTIARVLLNEAQTVTATPRLPFVSPQLPLSNFWGRRLRMDAIFSSLLVVRQQAEWNLTRGWLALEAGRCGEARKHFRTARDLAVPLRRWVPEIDKLNAWLVDREEVPRWRQLGISHAVVHDLSVRYLKWLEEKRTP